MQVELAFTSGDDTQYFCPRKVAIPIDFRVEK